VLVNSGALTGSVWLDANRNGVRDGNEPPIEGTTLFVDTNGNGTLDTTAELPEPLTVTDSLGRYRFTALKAGGATVYHVPPEGWVPTQPAVNHSTVSVNTGKSVRAINFGGLR
jgi:hypothetical protein